MVSLVDFNTAVRMREAMQQIATSTLEYMAPDARYATVLAINTATRTVTVKYPDEALSFTVPCGTVMPLTIGSLVRVAGKLGARYIDEVLDGRVQLNNLRLLDVGDASLGSTGHGFQLGPSNSLNLILDQDSIMARNNGAASDLYINPYGGLVRVGSVLGSGYVMMMGNDTIWADINVGNAIGLLGNQNTNAGELRLGNVQTKVGTDGVNSWLISGAGYLHLSGIGNTYLDGDTLHFRNTGGGEYAYMDNGALGLWGTRPFYFPSYGGGWYMSDTTWIRTYNGKSIFAGNGVIAGDGGTSFGIGYYPLGGSRVMADGNSYDHVIHGTVGMYPHLRVWRNLNAVGVDRPWTSSQLIVASTGAGGTHSAMIALWANGSTAGVAPVINCYEGGGLGEVVSFNNSPNTGYVPILANNYLTPSNLDTKEDVREISGRLIDRCRTVRPKVWKRSVKAQQLRVKDEVARNRRRMQQLGREVPELKEADFQAFDHDCAIDGCNGTPENPCSIVLNHNQDKIGLIVEELHTVLPEAVAYDQDRRPAFLDVGQVASANWQMIMELADEVAELRAEIAALKAKK